MRTYRAYVGAMKGEQQMKIDAKIEFDDDVASEIGQTEVKVPVDIDRVFGTKAG